MIHYMITIDEVFLKEADTLLYEELWEPLGLPEDTRKKFPVNGEEFVFVALFLGQVVGSIVLILRPDSAEIRHTAIRSEYQRTGIGRNLWEQVSEFIKRKGIKKTEVYARDTSVAFWEKMGFQSVSDWLDHEVFADTDIKFKKMVKVNS